MKLRFCRQQLLLLTALTNVFVLASLVCIFESLFWWGELFTPFTVQYIILGSILCIWALLQRLRKVALLVGMLSLYHIAIFGYAATQFSNPPLTANANGTELRVLQFNARIYNPSPQATVDALVALASNHDILVMQEYPYSFAQVDLSGLHALYPHHYVARGGITTLPGIAIFSKTPFITDEIVGHGVKASYLRVTLSEPEIQFIALHSMIPFDKPWVESRNLQQNNVMREISVMPYGAFAVGDFNQTPYAQSFRTILHDNEVRLATFPDNLLPSWPSFLPTILLRIPIDHMVVNDKAHIISRELIEIEGSDHSAVSNHLLLLSHP
ncbi:MAG: endonuclease/exonuclease/phosphatase family protein [Alphaproteobacteria bacterium]|nr:endonuclease/exonuclease/phosphatase family protein [Alphaproteobacteria bacterium]